MGVHLENLRCRRAVAQLAWDYGGNLVLSHNEARSYGWDRANRLTLVLGEMESGEYEDGNYGYDPSGRLMDRERVYGTLEKRYYADGLSPILVKRWDGSLNYGMMITIG